MRRRFSDFYSFRELLAKEYPMLVVPPLPEKQVFSLGAPPRIPFFHIY